jgi:uncharacterized protein (TIGR02246 family)
MLHASMQFAIAAPGNLSGDTKASAEVWSTFQAWLHAYDAGDLTQIMAIFDRGVVFAFQGAKDQSYDHLRRSYESDLKTRTPGTTWVPDVEEIYSDGRLAFVRSIWELHVFSATTQDQVKARNRSLDVLRKEAGSWRIIRSINYPERH